MKQFDVIIVGAGPAGMSAAIAAAREDQEVLLLEGADKIGKKILVTGNGRCNLSNVDQVPEHYRSDCPDRAWKVLTSFSDQEMEDFFGSLGIITRNKNGYIYPYNEQAASVRDAFEICITYERRIKVETGAHVDDIEPVRKGYLVRTKDRKYTGHSVIITTGGYAGPKIGCDGSGYRLACRLGHEIIKPLPALTPLKSSAPFLKKVSGVRNQARITLMIDGQEVVTEEGELQWTDYGISGVAIFQISRFAITALEQGQKVSLDLDFTPEWTESQLRDLLYKLKKKCSYKTALEWLYGILPYKLLPVVLREARIGEEVLVADLKNSDLDALVKAIKHFVLRTNGYIGYEKAQVTRGGISLNEVKESLESVYHKGLFFAGEVLDVDGTCGGYNLQWAFRTGNLAGRAAAQYRIGLRSESDSERK